MALKLSKKKKRLKYKQNCRGLRDNGDASLAVMGLTEASFSNLEYPADDIPTIAKFLESPLAKYITLAANDCGYSGTAEELVVSYVHPLFLKAHSATSKEDNLSYGSKPLKASSLMSTGRLWSLRLPP